MADLHIIDTSGEQHPNGAAIDWHAVRASDIDGVYVKLSEGGNVDPHGAQDVHDAASAGLLVGVYHFARPDLGNSPQAEIAVFNTARAGLPCALPPCLDSERYAPNLGVWNDQALAAIGDGAIGYSDRALRGALHLPDGKVWIAIPNQQDRGDWLGIQYGVAIIPGISVQTDVSWFNPSILGVTMADQLTLDWSTFNSKGIHAFFATGGLLHHSWSGGGGEDIVGENNELAGLSIISVTGVIDKDGTCNLDVRSSAGGRYRVYQGMSESVWHVLGDA